MPTSLKSSGISLRRFPKACGDRKQWVFGVFASVVSVVLGGFLVVLGCFWWVFDSFGLFLVVWGCLVFGGFLVVLGCFWWVFGGFGLFLVGF